MVSAAYAILMLIARIFAVCVAAMCFYMAFFMYKNDADVWQNRLVDLWTEIAGGSHGLLSEQAALVRKSSMVVTHWLTWLLGERLVSLQVIAVSLLLSCASTMAILSSSALTSNRVNFWAWGRQAAPPRWQLVAFLMVMFLLFAVLGIRRLCNLGRPRLALAIAVMMGMLSFSFMFRDHLAGDQASETMKNLVVTAIVAFLMFAQTTFGVLCDLMMLLVNRLVLQSMVKTSKAVDLLAGFVYNVIWVGFLADSTVYWFREMAPTWSSWRADPVEVFFRSSTFQRTGTGLILREWLLLALTSNLFTLCVSTSFLVIIAAALFHRLFWPLAERSIYALYTNNIFTNKKLQIAAGVALLSFAFPWSEEFLKRLFL